MAPSQGLVLVVLRLGCDEGGSAERLWDVKGDLCGVSWVRSVPKRRSISKCMVNL